MYPDPIILCSTELTCPYVLERYKNIGYTYIRQFHMPYNIILRSPSVGCIVQLTCYKEIGSHLLDSSKARKLIRRISYFGYL